MEPKGRFPLIEEVLRLGRAIKDKGGRPILVGGWVRDCLLGIPHSKDFDIEVFGLAPAALKEVLGRFGPVHTVGKHFGVLKLATRQAEYDVSVPRRESKTGKGHKGFWVEPDPGMTFEEAAYRRDFTINSMGYEFLEESFLDPYRGLEDLEQRRLRHVGPAFGEDPLRVLRAMQFAGRFELEILPETVALCREQDLSELPKERIWEEVKKLLLRARAPSHGWAYAHELGVLAAFPELARLHAAAATGIAGGPWARTLRVLDQAAALRQAGGAAPAHAEPSIEASNSVLMIAALCCELDAEARPVEGGGNVSEAGTLLARLTAEVELTRRVLALLRDLPAVSRLHAGRAHSQDAALRRLALRVELPLLLRLAEAQLRVAAPEPDSARPSAVAWLEQQAARLGVLAGPPEAILKGRHLLDLGMAAGPQMGKLLEQAFERQLDGELTSLEQALEWARAHAGAGVPAQGEPKP